MIYDIAVSVGHNARRPGHKEHNVSEYSEMVVVAGLLVQGLQMQGHNAFLVGARPLDQKVSQVNNPRCDCAIELHLNKGGGVGFETLYMNGSAKGKALACHVHKAVSPLLGRDRGVKVGWHHQDQSLGMNYFLKATNCPAIITELYFLDNAGERELYTGNIEWCQKIAGRIAVGILLYLNGLDCPEG